MNTPFQQNWQKNQNTTGNLVNGLFVVARVMAARNIVFRFAMKKMKVLWTMKDAKSLLRTNVPTNSPSPATIFHVLRHIGGWDRGNFAAWHATSLAIQIRSDDDQLCAWIRMRLLCQLHNVTINWDQRRLKFVMCHYATPLRILRMTCWTWTVTIQLRMNQLIVIVR